MLRSPSSLEILLVANLREQMLLFYLRQQKFLELLEVGSRARALEVMRSELVPLDQPLELTRPLARYEQAVTL